MKEVEEDSQKTCISLISQELYSLITFDSRDSGASEGGQKIFRGFKATLDYLMEYSSIQT
jgi:hypothetical protein